MQLASALQPEAVAINAWGAVLQGHVFAPDAGPPRIAIVLHPATGVPQSYYAKFAQWLAVGHQAAVLTYDYRDMGASARGPMKAARASMADWGVLDQSAALDALCGRFPDVPVWVVGHSLGGMYVPWHDKAGRIERIIAVASGPAYFMRHPLLYLPLVFWFWFIAGPVLTTLFGYLPGKRAGLGADIPAAAFWQWRRWCLSRDFNRMDWGKDLPVPDLTRIKSEVRLVGISDDKMIPPVSVKMLAAYYPAARVSYREITPASIGGRGIGHLRVFSERCKAAWPVIMGTDAARSRQAA